ncbi:MAG: fatty acid desaturase [Deltaproteobacteria bacterium]|nr:fatty acid desaturase [Deltaproteobacteria bacterium]
MHAIAIATCIWLLASGVAPAWTWPFLSIAIGCSMAGVTFLAHETLHGGVVRGRWAIRVIGYLGFLPFCLSPQLWTAWHNRVHHNHCGQPGIDPDMYPTIDEYRAQKRARVMADYFSIGRRRVLGVLSLLFGFTGQSTQILMKAGRAGYLTPRQHRRAIAATVVGFAFWATIGVLIGFVPFVFAYLIPLVVANTIVMAFIMTNHNLSPLTPINDPLVNSLSVTLPRPFGWLTLGFGFHVEHHLFPTMSTRHGPAVRAAILAKFRERYQSMGLVRALHQLHKTARVYLDNTTLIDPHTNATWPTLVPGERDRPVGSS